MIDISWNDMKELMVLKDEHPEEYEQLIKSMTDVSMDIAEIAKKVANKMLEND